jgi:hypothetical protein
MPSELCIAAGNSYNKNERHLTGFIFLMMEENFQILFYFTICAYTVCLCNRRTFLRNFMLVLRIFEPHESVRKHVQNRGHINRKNSREEECPWTLFRYFNLFSILSLTEYFTSNSFYVIAKECRCVTVINLVSFSKCPGSNFDRVQVTLQTDLVIFLSHTSRYVFVRDNLYFLPGFYFCF